MLERSFFKGTKGSNLTYIWGEKQILNVDCLLKANYLNMIIAVNEEREEFNSFMQKYVQILNG